MARGRAETLHLSAEVFERRRRQFMAAIGEGAAAIVPASPERLRSGDVDHRYRQSSDLHYLTGFPEPGAVGLLLPGHAREEFVLFVRPRDRERETWTGRRFGIEGACSRFGAAIAYPIDKLDEVAPAYLAERDRWHYSFRSDDDFNAKVLQWVRQAQVNRPRAGVGPVSLVDTAEVLHEMRLRKGPEEIARMRRAIAITGDAHRAAMQGAWAGRFEYEIEALLEYTFRAAGATGPAYPSIVASGPNATVLHYNANERQIRDGELILIDAGAEYDAYCADVTRTFPVGGHFEGRQRAAYEVVLEAQLAAIGAVRPGARIDDVHRAAVRTLAGGLVDLGLLDGSIDQIEEKELYKPFYMHRTGHWLGLDVHDVGDYKRGGESRKLEVGMVLTVEPGLYVSEFVEGVDESWRGIGVRIEDDVLVTAEGHEVLSAEIPKSVAEVEALRREAQPLRRRPIGTSARPRTRRKRAAASRHER